MLASQGIDEAGLEQVLSLAARGSWAHQDKALATALLEHMSHYKIEIDPEWMLEIARKALGYMAEEEMTTFAQYFWEKGRKEGLEQGIEQRLEQGLEQGMQQIVLSLIQRRFGTVPKLVEEEVRSIQGQDLLGELNLAAAEAETIEAFIATLRSLRH